MKIGLILPLVEIRSLGRALTFDEVRALAQQAEQLGFDSIWIYDHLLYRQQPAQTTGIWECWSVLSALAACTNRVELGPLVACNSFRNPAILAKMAHTVDAISAGRLILGVGCGWNQPEYDAFGLPFDHRVDRFEEALQIIRPLLQEGRVDFTGQYYTARDCEITPRSPRPGGPPLLIGASGPRMLRLTARYADQWNVGYLSIPRSIDKMQRAMLKACRAEGRDPASLDFTYMINMAYPDLLEWPKAKKRGYLTGSTEEIAAALTEFEARRAAHLMFQLNPASPQGFERLARSVELYRAARL